MVELTPYLISHSQEIDFDKLLTGFELPGLIMEFGVSSGATIKRLASQTSRQIYGFDWFKGLPEKWGDHDIGAFGVESIPDVPGHVALVVGLFQESLPKFLRDHTDEKVAFLHMDADIYSATKYVLDQLRDRFQDGTVIAFDEIINNGGNLALLHEFRAFKEFLAETGFGWEIVGMHGGDKATFRIYPSGER